MHIAKSKKTAIGDAYSTGKMAIFVVLIYY